MKKTKTIKDPIHGFIPLTSLQEELLSQPELQRLAWIKQLGLTFLVYPGAHQTRLEHSLGTSHIARKIASKLELNEKEKKTLQAAGMLHDLGHAPFSHTIERVAGRDHTEVTRDIIEGEMTFDIPGSGRIPTVLEEHGIEPEKIAELVVEEEKNQGYLHDVISSQMDADQLDYLARDAHYTGVAYGSIETQRIINTMRIKGNKLVYQEKGLDSLEDCLIARDHMYSSVYIHKTVAIAEKMLYRATEEASPVDNLYSMRDGELLELLKESNSFSREMANRIIYRNLYKQAYTIKNTDTQKNREALQKANSKTERQIEKEIAEKAGLNPDKIIVNHANELVKESEPRIREFNINISKNGDVVPIEDISEIARALKEKTIVRNIFSVYTPQKHRNKVRRVTEEYLSE